MCNKEEIGEAFSAVKYKYPQLKNVNVTWRFTRNHIFTDTMYTYLNPFSLLWGKRKYLVFVNIGFGKKFLDSFCKEDLKGWFSHELAHIVDYETMSRTAFVMFVFKYLLNPNFRYTTERRINTFAYNYGFAREFFNAAKVFYSVQSKNSYKERLRKNYRAPWEEGKLTLEQQGISEQEYKSLSFPSV